MSESPKAVFLSYAREDTDAARRIAEALRGFGVEVWFDQNELRGGDSWDQKIRKQIKDCALFLPIISGHTQARGEGYFRLEWKLAAERTHLMAEGLPFVLPLVVDDARENEARVPAEFMRVQWMRLPGALPTPQFVEQVKRLLNSSDKPAAESSRNADAPHRAAPRRSNLPLALIGVGAVAVIGAAIYFAQKSSAPVAVIPPRAAAVTTAKTTELTAPADKSIAVLAFADLSEGHNSEYFSDGISEELLNVLAKVPGLKVTARTSSFHFKGKDTPIPEIARQLDVAYVVEGSVRKAGDKIRITAQLIKAADGYHVWSDTFTRDLKDVFAVQDEIAGLIAQNLKLKLGAEARADRVVNPEAHQLFLEGKFFLNQFTYESATKAVGLLQRAVQLDGQFALAWAAMSRAGSVQGGYANTRQGFQAGYKLAREAANRALELDSKLAVAYLAQFEVRAGSDFDWKGARESLRRAQELAPTSAEVLDSAARLAYYFGEREKAVELGAQAVALDPVNPAVRGDHGFALMAVGRYEDAEAEFRRLIELNPKAPWGHAGVSFAFTAAGRFDEAAVEATLETNEWSRLYALALAQWGQKKSSEADATLALLIKNDADVAAYQIAEVYAFRRDNDRAFEWLERAYRQRDSGLAWSRSSLFFESLRADPRWEIFMHKLGLADEQLK